MGGLLICCWVVVGATAADVGVALDVVIAAIPALTSSVEGTAKLKPFPAHALETIDAASVTAAAPQF